MKQLVPLLLIVIIYGCSKSSPSTYYVSKAIKTDFTFKKGSYWIMKDSISGRIDSFFVINYRDSTVQATVGGTFEEHTSINLVECSINTPSFTDSLYWGYSYEGSQMGLYCSESKIIYGVISYNPFLKYGDPGSFSLSKDYIFNNDTGVVNNVFDNYQVAGQSFTNVAAVNHYALFQNGSITGTSPYGYNDWFYVCPKIGIVKMRLNHPQDSIYRVWEIQRWKIAK